MAKKYRVIFRNGPPTEEAFILAIIKLRKIIIKQEKRRRKKEAMERLRALLRVDAAEGIDHQKEREAEE